VTDNQPPGDDLLGRLRDAANEPRPKNVLRPPAEVLKTPAGDYYIADFANKFDEIDLVACRTDIFDYVTATNWGQQERSLGPGVVLHLGKVYIDRDFNELVVDLRDMVTGDEQDLLRQVAKGSTEEGKAFYDAFREAFTACVNRLDDPVGAKFRIHSTTQHDAVLLLEKADVGFGFVTTMASEDKGFFEGTLVIKPS